MSVTRPTDGQNEKLFPFSGSRRRQHFTYIIDVFFFSSRRRHTRWTGDWSSDVCSSDLPPPVQSGGKTAFAAHGPCVWRSQSPSLRGPRSYRPQPSRGRRRNRSASHSREIGRASCRERV